MKDVPNIDSAQSCGAAPASQTAAAGRAAPNSIEQMKSLAAQFEAVLLGQMMKQMRESLFSENEEDGKASGFAGGPLADQVYQELNLAISRAGGVGLGQALGGALARQAEALGGMSTGFGNASRTPSLGLPMPAGLDQDLPAADPITASGLLGPSGRVSSPFGWRQDPFGAEVKFHNGTDIAMPVGQDVLAAQAGQVESVGEVAGYGLTVVVRHPGGLATRYAHLSEAAVKVGQAVTQGQVIAKSGSSGKSTGPHLHFEVLKDGQAVDPGRW
jgi:murein DD-endopeptidase MepM/ murein hydrolase activator NlpD